MSDTVPIQTKSSKICRGKNTIKRIKTKIKKNLVRKTVVATWATVSVVTIVILVKKNGKLSKDLTTALEGYLKAANQYSILQNKYLDLSEGYIDLSENVIDRYEALRVIPEVIS